MRIYIDESGPFVVPPDGRSRVSCVAALVIPSSREAEILPEFRALTSRWKLGEIKGSQLNESQMDEALSLFADYDLLAEVVGIDLGLKTVEELGRFRDGQADLIVAGFPPSEDSEVTKHFRRLSELWRGLSYQLSVQAILTVLLIEEVLRLATMYYVQRDPSELSSLSWLVDAKELSRTKYEDLWTTLLRPFLMTQFRKDPLVTLEDEDYSAFEKAFGIRESDATTQERAVIEWLEAEPSPRYPATGNRVAFDMRKIYRDLTFGDSRSNETLQMVDFVASAFSRACNGTLQEPGWRNLPRLLVEKGVGLSRLVDIRPDRKLVGESRRELMPPGQLDDIMAKLNDGKSLWRPSS